MVRQFLVSFLLFVFYSTYHSHAGKVVEVPQEFPGHTSRPINHLVKSPDTFNPKHYQQEKLKKEGACIFNSLFAGIMHTSYGRKQIQERIGPQDDKSVQIRFWFPNAEIMGKYDFVYKEDIKTCEDAIKGMSELLNSDEYDESGKDDIRKDIEEVKNSLKNAPLLWEKILYLHQTSVRVPKKFVWKNGGGSFPESNPEWLNLIQQAYMKITKHSYLTTSFGGYSRSDEDILEEDVFTGVPFCTLIPRTYGFPDGYTNNIEDPCQQILKFFPLIDIPFKEVKIITSEMTGLNLEEIKDVSAKLHPDNSVSYQPLTYQTNTDFAHTHGLSKDLLMEPNVIQFSSAGHEVALFFGSNKVYYYDNVVFPDQIEIYGEEGPIYTEALYFKDHGLDTMTEETFFINLFKEIHHRGKQVAKIRNQPENSQTKIRFFTRALKDL